MRSCNRLDASWASLHNSAPAGSASRSSDRKTNTRQTKVADQMAVPNDQIPMIHQLTGQGENADSSAVG